MKYAPEKAILEAELVNVIAKIDAICENIRDEIERGVRDPNDCLIPMEFIEEKRNLEIRINMFAPIFEVGDGISRHGYSDIAPFEVIEVSKSGKKIKCRAMKADLDPAFKPEFIPGGFSAHCVNNNEQKWIIESNPDGEIIEVSLRSIKCNPLFNGGLERVEKWVPVGMPAKIGERVISAGAKKFYDYNF